MNQTTKTLPITTKSSIYWYSASNYWNLNYLGYIDIPFCTWEGAMHYLVKNTEQAVRTDKAWARIKNELNITLLSVAESKLIAKLVAKQCKGITKKQYGWLVGIIERQK